MKYELLKATTFHIPAIESLYRQFVKDEYEVAPVDRVQLLNVDTRIEKVSRILNYFNNPERTWFVALDGLEVIGTILLTVKSHAFLDRKVGRIDLVFVVREYRRQGIARALMKKAIELARAKGCKWTCLDTLETNEAAKGLYGALGYKSFLREMVRPIEE